MKRRVLIGLLVAVCVLFGVQAVGAASSGESLISVSYLTNTFLPDLAAMFQQRANQDTKGVYDAAQARLNELGSAYLNGGEADNGGWTVSDTAVAHTVKRGDVITVSTGSTVLWTSGAATATAGLVDATAGSEPATGTRLTAGHRYLNGAEGQAVTVTVLSDAATVLLEGRWTLTRSDESVTGFTDLVKSSDWFYDAVRYAVDRGMFNGVSPTQFAPDAVMDRAMLATVLYRLEGSPAVEYSGVFRDVPNGEWYAGSVEWAASRGIVNGMGDGRFGPNIGVTREQIALMLYRYARDHLGLDVSQAGDLSAFADGRSVSDWAGEGMRWAVGAGIISGSDTNQLMPGSSASRAQVATMLQRFQVWAGRG